MPLLRLPRVLLAALALATCAAWAQAAGDLTFFHLSDVHYPYAAGDSRKTIAELPVGRAVDMPAFGLSVPPASFAIVTGDLDEYGGGKGWWEGYLALWEGLGLRLYHQLGNHDNTWDCGRPRLRRIHGGAFYAFEHSGIKFIGWDSATPQDPRPSVATEGLLWLAAQLDATPHTMPIAFFCHHAPEGREFSGSYAKSRLTDLLGTRRIALMLVGHGHGARHWQIEGVDMVMGGSTYGPNRGFGIVSVKDGILRISHRFVGDKPRDEKLLEKPLGDSTPLLRMEISPQDGAVLAPHEPLRWTVRADPAGAVTGGEWLLDGDAQGELTRRGEAWVAEASREGLESGAHQVSVQLALASGESLSRTVAFWLEGGSQFRMAWKYQLSGSCQCTPLVAGGVLYVGANDGCLYALDAAGGDLKWRFVTGGEVRGTPILDPDAGRIIFGSADGKLRAVSVAGEPVWEADAGSPVYGSGCLSGGVVYAGTGSGDILAVRADSGEELWRCTEPDYAIETAPAVNAGRVFAGSWDRYLYALDAATGALVWRKPSRGSDRPGDVARYYSPADCRPVAVGERVFAADRAYFLSVLDAGSGERVAEEPRTAAVGLGADGASVLVRHSDGRVSRRAADGTVLWTSEAPTGAIAAPPVDCGEWVAVVSDRGTLSLLEAKTGQPAGRYRAFPGTYVYAEPAWDGARMYLCDMLGTVVALERD